ncbi:MAG: nucleotidyl transferase AbiEii/AbiGii toxin family protein [Chlamydiales bacterium]
MAKEKNIHFNECWKKLILERFLFRLSCSSYRKKFIFKGGFLLAYLIEIGRETMDLDFLITKMKVKKKEIKEAINETVSLKLDDGVLFRYVDIELLEQPHIEYTGYRISALI